MPNSLGVYDSFGPTQNPNWFIEKSICFQKCVRFTRMCLCFDTSELSSKYVKFSDFQNLQESTNLKYFSMNTLRKDDCFGTPTNSYFILVPPGVTTFWFQNYQNVKTRKCPFMFWHRYWYNISNKIEHSKFQKTKNEWKIDKLGTQAFQQIHILDSDMEK